MNEKHRKLYNEWYDSGGNNVESFTEFLVRQISGLELDKPNFQSGIKQTKITVKPRVGGRQEGMYYTPITDEVLRDRARKAVEGSTTDEAVSQALHAIRTIVNEHEARINTLDAHVDELYDIVTDLIEKVDALEGRVASAEAWTTPLAGMSVMPRFDTEAVVKELYDALARAEKMKNARR